MVFFVGAGPGAADLITVRGRNLLEQADVIVYAGSLVPQALLACAKTGCRLHNSAAMTLEQVMAVMLSAARAGETVVRLHTGDPALYGAIGEQMRRLDREQVEYEVVPGVSSFSAAAAVLGREYTVPGGSQTLILTRVEGRTPVREEEDLARLAAHGSSLAVFLSAGMLEKLTAKLLEAGRGPDDPAAVVYRASWPEEKVIRTTVAGLARAAREAGISNHALILVGEFLEAGEARSLLYHPDFAHGFREVGE